MEIVFSEIALEDLAFWRTSGNKAIQKKIQSLLEEICVTPYEGTGKPELLKHNWAGFWSRRITNEHRLVYKVEDEKILVVQLRYHYDR